MEDESLAVNSLVSGACAGVVCSILCAPLDIAKVRQQVQGSLKLKAYKGTFGAIRGIYKAEGARGLFKGLGTALFNVPLFWSIYWYSYENMKVYLHKEYPTISPHLLHITAAGVSGGIADFITNPFWVVRTRIQTLVMHPESHLASSSARVTTPGMFMTIFREEGPLAFYKGLTASFLGLPHVAIQFPLYEFLKGWSRDNLRWEIEHSTEAQQQSCDSNFLDFFFASSIAKITACCVTYPHEVLRARMQDSRSAHPSIIRITRDIIKEEGVTALW
eukprot:CAMPEP_0185033846 /NCGR_PEP_ID=MMETSP1103-20130426/23210_1 /TAXON_ID=36769 /ORGANISM="Paraphysomonas bandaiensis, Strain Caron Lab Isolate" /LENGTH=274 /DNA_ID=CAMNT_0027570265 /DNA_START=26 /DNA_END=847 /DNA_ORIENTATION=+